MAASASNNRLTNGTYSYLKKKNLNPYENISAEQEITRVISRTNITESNSLHKIQKD